MAVTTGTVLNANLTGTPATGTKTYVAGSESVLAVVLFSAGGVANTETVSLTGYAGTPQLWAQDSGGGSTGVSIWYLTNPTSGNLTYSRAVSGTGGTFVLIPLVGAATATPFGTVSFGTVAGTSTPTSGSITGGILQVFISAA